MLTPSGTPEMSKSWTQSPSYVTLGFSIPKSGAGNWRVLAWWWRWPNSEGTGDPRKVIDYFAISLLPLLIQLLTEKVGSQPAVFCVTFSL